MIILITYDLKGATSQYTELYEYLKSLKGWSHYLSSTWLVDTDKNPDQIVDDIKPFLQQGDRIIAVKFDPPYQGWLPKKAWEWIHNHEK